MKTGAERKKKHDDAKREQGKKEFRAWVTRGEHIRLRRFLESIRL